MKTKTKFIILIGGLIIALIVMSYRAFAEEVSKDLPELYIKAINPGYTIDDKSNVGELIEIGRNGSNEMISLAGITIGYTNSSGNDSILFEFPENSFLTGESILLRLASSPESELAAMNYSKTLAFKAGLALKRGEEVLDDVCWTGKDGCYKEFKSSDPTFLVRNTELNMFEHLKEYVPNYDLNAFFLQKEEGEDEKSISPQCRGVQFSEILSYYDTSKSEQFVELFNSGSEQVLLDGCKLRYKNKNYDLSGMMKPEGYLAYFPRDFSLTKNPTNKNTLELIDVDGTTLDTLNYFNGQRKGTAYAMIGFDSAGEEVWKTTYAPTPGAGNVYQEYKTCEEGKVINEETGNCVKVVSVTAKTCPEGQYLNILTGRCRKIAQETAKKDCKEGYYLNPETNRCKKIVENKGANYELKPDSREGEKNFVAWYIVGIVVLIGIGYLIFEFRTELARLFRKVFRLSR